MNQELLCSSFLHFGAISGYLPMNIYKINIRRFGPEREYTFSQCIMYNFFGQW